jgi:signal transduction histidine kinase
MYRVAQEALANVVKHARASQVDVHLIRELGALVLEICDNGIGVSREVLSGERPQALGVGLASMRERIEALAGELRVRRLGPGTMVRASVPQRGRRFLSQAFRSVAPHDDQDRTMLLRIA